MILIDIDGVCLDYMGAIREVEPEFNPDKILSYDLTKGDFGISAKKVRKYFKSAKVMKMQKPYRRVKYGLTQLKELDDVKAWTYVDKSLVKIRKKQLDDLGIDGYISTEYPKPIIVEDVKVVIEDNPKALDMYKDKGVLRIIVTRSYNLDYKDYDYRVGDLREASRVIKESGVYDERKPIQSIRSTFRNIFGKLQEESEGTT